jgi:hypothetical protein
MFLRYFKRSHSSSVAAVEDGGSYSSSRRLWSEVCDKVSECTEHSFTIMELSSNFPQISRPLLHEIGTEHLLLRKLSARWVPKQLTPEHSGSNPRRQTSTTQYTEVGPTVWQMSQFRWRICWKKAEHLLYLLQWIFPCNYVLFLYTAPGKLTLWMSLVVSGSKVKAIQQECYRTQPVV